MLPILFYGAPFRRTKVARAKLAGYAGEGSGADGAISSPLMGGGEGDD